MKLTAIIVDDEQLARNLVREYLNNHQEIEIIDECDDGQSAIKTINERKPDIIFLDVQMPGCNGIEVLQSLHEIPLVIFSTAYEQYALKAFEVSAVDYLLKPYDRQRFDQAVLHALDRGNQTNNTEMTDRMISLMQQIQKEQTYTSRLFIKLRGKVMPIDVADIEWIEAQDDYGQIHTRSGSYLASETLTHLESLLNPNLFLRIHRSSLVNLDFIKELRRSSKGSYLVQLASGRELPVGRTKVAHLKEWIV